MSKAPHVIDRLTGYFGGYDRDPVLLGEVLTELLQPYPDEVIEHALRIIVTDFRPSNRQLWPAVKTIKEALGRAASAAHTKKAAAYLDARRQNPSTPSNHDKALSLLRTDIGRRAAREGWVMFYYDHCERHGRPPSMDEVTSMRRKCFTAENAYRDLLSLPPTPLNMALRKLGDAVLARAKSYADIALEGTS